ncbi:16364_t:CDS:2 [Acaulospora morrowiae]|uniref:16364_t:CDS:1 n=1 Tax=Acaulospora morrowiae TaxID=94023 RepID=A0A9N8YM64_9GLOM|nr:16364_t:CDS:2 [Acaulospora morrowiae]
MITPPLETTMFKNSIHFVPSKAHSTLTIEKSSVASKEQVAEDTVLFYKSVISSPSTAASKRTVNGKLRKIRHKRTQEDSTRQKINKRRNVGSSNGTSLALLQMYNDDKEEINNVESLNENKRKRKEVKNNELVEQKSGDPSKPSYSDKDGRIWCKDCEVWVIDELYKNHVHGTAHLVSSKTNEEAPPDPIILNETNLGFRMLRDQGWKYEKGLGVHEQGRRHPISTKLKNDKFGIGVKLSKLVPKVPLKRLSAKEAATQYEKDRRNRIRLLAYMNR